MLCPVPTGLAFTWHCRAPIKCYNTQLFLPPNSVNTVLADTFSMFEHSSHLHIGTLTWPWLFLSPYCHQCVALCKYMHLSTTFPLMWDISCDGYKKKHPVCQQWNCPWDNAAFVTQSSSHSAPMGPLGHGGQTEPERQEGYLGTVKHWAHWTDKPRGLRSGCTLLRLAHGQNGEWFNLNFF